MGLKKNKAIQLSRMWKYFVEATAEIIEEEGVANVTIRKIADRAGYNSATIYNYFSEISHLIFFASMRFLKPYTEAIVQVYKNPQLSTLEKYLQMWELFCRYSFKHPDIFHAIFVADLGSHPNELLKHYYSLYPADIIDIPEPLQPIFLEQNVSKRGLPILEQLVKEGYIKPENVHGINNMTLLIWNGMFTAFLNNRHSYDPEEATSKTMLYIREIVRNANCFSFAEEEIQDT